jgi:hypothetical protein
MPWNALTIGPSLTLTSPSARPPNRLGQSGAGHAARHLIEIGKETPDLGAREGNGKDWRSSTPFRWTEAIDRVEIRAGSCGRGSPRRTRASEKSLACRRDASRPADRGGR